MSMVAACTHRFVTEVDDYIKGYDHPLICDDCSEIIECDHEWEFDEDAIFCWVCGTEVN